MSVEGHKNALKTSVLGMQLMNVLERSRKVHDFYKLKGWTRNPFEQVAHCHAELSEIWDVLRNKKNKYGVTLSDTWKDHFAGESCDGIITVLTLFYLLDFTDEDIIKAMDKTVKKLEDRVEQEVSIYRHDTSVIREKVEPT
ncbi:MAG: hypothetical protein KGI08_09425 [Thaumarchaeota archaeon]|nr:hypothetical protein [Nitrososphaerota archaeon]